VKWTNREKRTSHSVVFPQEGGLRVRAHVSQTKAGSANSMQAGRYDYTCGPHPEMKGVVIVVE
jgi:plastocyanin